MNKLIILQGLPASGKSTWARNHANHHTLIVSADGIRRMLAGSLQTWHALAGSEGKLAREIRERLAVTTAMNTARQALDLGYTVIADMQNLDPRTIRAWKNLANAAGVETETIRFDQPLDVLLERNRNRPEDDRVDETYLRKAYRRERQRHHTAMKE